MAADAPPTSDACNRRILCTNQRTRAPDTSIGFRFLCCLMISGLRALASGNISSTSRSLAHNIHFLSCSFLLHAGFVVAIYLFASWNGNGVYLCVSARDAPAENEWSFAADTRENGKCFAGGVDGGGARICISNSLLLSQTFAFRIYRAIRKA